VVAEHTGPGRQRAEDHASDSAPVKVLADIY
jgi:hypothetical protein